MSACPTVSVYKDRGEDNHNASYYEYSSSVAERHLIPPTSSQSAPCTPRCSMKVSLQRFDISDYASLQSRMAKLEQTMDMTLFWRDGDQRRAEASWWKEQVMQEQLLHLEARVSSLEGSNVTFAASTLASVVPTEAEEKFKVDEMLQPDKAAIHLDNVADERVKSTGNESIEKSLTVDDLISKCRTYPWEASVYDGLLLAFLPHLRMSVMQSILIISGFLINAFLITVILLIIGDSEFHAKAFSKSALQEWRSSDGHSASWAHPASSVTLVSRVCSLDETLSFATRQTSLIQDIRFYQDRNRGQLLCNVAIILWCFCCCNEFRSALRFGAAILNITRGDTTLAIGPQSGDNIELSSISLPRAITASVIAAARAASAIALMYWGGLYLATTTSLEELLLNASALGFVLDIDNEIFSVLAPLRAIECLQNLAPVPIPNSRVINIIPSVLTLSIVAFTVYSNLAVINPLSADMSDALKILCDPPGSLQYTIASDMMGRTLYTEDTPSWRAGRKMFVQGQIVSELTQNSNNGKKFAIRMGSLGEFSWMREASIEDLVSYYSCYDGNTLDSSTTVGHRLYAITGFNSHLDLKSCADAHSLCDGIGEDWSVGSNVRLMCPDTCGCANVYGGLWDLARTYNGCPQSSCVERMERVLKRKRDIPCRDRNLTFLRQNGWKLLSDRMLASGTIKEELHNNLTTLGCEAFQFVSRGTRKRICALSDELSEHGAAPFCPISCKCGTDSIGNCFGLCPSSCCSN